MIRSSRMPKDHNNQKIKLDEVAEKLAVIIETYLATLTAADAAATRKDIHSLAVKPSRK